MIALLKKIIKWIRQVLREKLHTSNPDLPYYVTILLAIVLLVATTSAFVEITDELMEEELTGADEAVTDLVLGLRSNGLDAFFTFITHLGDRYAYTLITIAMAVFFFLRYRNRRFALQTVIVLILSSLSNVVIKEVINRPRPTLDHLVEVNTLSFPSGHSMSAMAFYGFLIYLCLRNQIPLYLKSFLVTLLLLIIAGIGLSRIYLGVHFPSDVAAGFLGGAIWVSFCVVVFNIFELLRKKKKEPGASVPG